MERASSVTVPYLARAQLTKVLSSLGDGLVIQLEYDSASFFVVNGDIKLYDSIVSYPLWTPTACIRT